MSTTRNRAFARTIIIVGIWHALLGAAQAQNLIPNSGFEELDESCTGGASYSILAEWFPTDCSSGGTFFHPCGTANGDPTNGAPDNVWGGQAAFDGIAYAGTLTYLYAAQFPPHNYLAVPLITPLIGGTEYCFSLHASLAGRSTYRSQTLSAAFTTYYPTACSGNDTLNWTTESQIVFDLSALDTTSWSVLSGSFTASGGEEYLTLGNYTNYQDPDTAFFGWSTAPLTFAFYYIDALELRTCESGIHEWMPEPLDVFPNPAKDVIQLNFDCMNCNATYSISDIMGRVLVRGWVTSNMLDISTLPSGSYIITLKSTGTLGQARFVVQH